MPKDGTTSRRDVLKYTGSAALAGGFASTAGCIGPLGGDDDDGILIGGTVPLSGPFASVGENQRTGIEIAVEKAREEGDIDEEIEVEFVDTETDPSTGRRRAEELLDDGADFLVGCLSSGVAESISELCTRDEKIGILLAGTNSLTGENCAPYTFVPSNSATVQTQGGIGYAMREGVGETMYQITSDYTWGHTVSDYSVSIVEEYGGESLGETLVPVGETDYASAIADVQDADPDIVNVNTAHGDYITSANQLGEFGVYDERNVTFPASGVGNAIGIDPEYVSHPNVYKSVNYDWTIDTPANNELVDEFLDRGDEPPFAFTPPVYIGVRTVLTAMEEEGATDGPTLRSALEGRELFPQIWGMGEYLRECDHRGTTPSLTVRGRDGWDGEDWDWADILADFGSVEDVVETQMRTCEETGCQLD